MPPSKLQAASSTAICRHQQGRIMRYFIAILIGIVISIPLAIFAYKHASSNTDYKIEFQGKLDIDADPANELITTAGPV